MAEPVPPRYSLRPRSKTASAAAAVPAAPAKVKVPRSRKPATAAAPKEVEVQPSSRPANAAAAVIARVQSPRAAAPVVLPPGPSVAALVVAGGIASNAALRAAVGAALDADAAAAAEAGELEIGVDVLEAIVAKTTDDADGDRARALLAMAVSRATMHWWGNVIKKHITTLELYPVRRINKYLILARQLSTQLKNNDESSDEYNYNITYFIKELNWNSALMKLAVGMLSEDILVTLKYAIIEIGRLNGPKKTQLDADIKAKKDKANLVINGNIVVLTAILEKAPKLFVVSPANTINPLTHLAMAYMLIGVSAKNTDLFASLESFLGLVSRVLSEKMGERPTVTLLGPRDKIPPFISSNFEVSAEQAAGKRAAAGRKHARASNTTTDGGSGARRRPATAPAKRRS